MFNTNQLFSIAAALFLTPNSFADSNGTHLNLNKKSLQNVPKDSSSTHKSELHENINPALTHELMTIYKMGMLAESVDALVNALSLTGLLKPNL